MAEHKRAKLEAELESVNRVLRDALDWIGDDRNLTDKGLAARQSLLGEIEEIERDLEAIRQEHMLE
jgi:hypothetical protein